MRIYQHRSHAAVTVAFVVAPFIFLLAFSRLAHIATAQLFTDASTSILRLVVAYAIAVALAWAAAVLFYRGRRALVALPIFDVLQSFPTFAALPLATLLWGRSDNTVIIFLVITIIWPLFFSIVSSLKLVHKDLEEAAEMSGLTGFDYLHLFLWPVSIPGLITGSVIGLGEAWEALVATEIITGVPNGLGSFFQTFSGSVSITAFGILGLLILIFSLNKLVWLPLLESSHQRMEE